VLPAGRLREQRSAASRADALITAERDPAVVKRLADELRVPTIFQMSRTLGAHPAAGTGSVFAVAGIARPERFFDALRLSGYRVAGTISFRDHHAFSDGDTRRIEAAARAAGAEAIVTTEKDAVRMEHHRWGMRVDAVPLKATMDAAFAGWLDGRIAAIRADRQRMLQRRDASA
jgi:tetraacyldisaccharide 4'-kinase